MNSGRRECKDKFSLIKYRGHSSIIQQFCKGRNWCKSNPIWKVWHFGNIVSRECVDLSHWSQTLITGSNKNARNMRKTQMLSLGHTGGAIKSMVVMNIPGVFVTKDGSREMWVVLMDCSYNKEHHFTCWTCLGCCTNKAGRLQGWLDNPQSKWKGQINQLWFHNAHRERGSICMQDQGGIC